VVNSAAPAGADDFFVHCNRGCYPRLISKNPPGFSPGRYFRFHPALGAIRDEAGLVAGGVGIPVLKSAGKSSGNFASGIWSLVR